MIVDDQNFNVRALQLNIKSILNIDPILAFNG